MNTRACYAVGIAAIMLLLGAAAYPAHAQQLGPQPPPPPSDPLGIEILATPYLWMPWMSTAAHPLVPKLPGVQSRSDTVGAGTVISHITWVPFMGSGELRSGPYGVVVDYIHAPLKSGIQTPGIIFGGANAGLTMNEGSAIFMYRLLSDPVQYLDLGAGVRAWGFGGDLSLNQGLLPPVSVTKGGAWGDGLAALRYHRDLGDGFSATAYGDIGGGGASLDWQAVATLDYAVQSAIDLHVGFRALNFNQSDTLAGFNVHMYGPILAATFHFQ